MADKTKQIFESNAIIEIDLENGDIIRQFPITKTGNIIGLKEFIESSDKYNSALLLLAYNPYVVDEVTNKVYKIGVKNAKLYWQEATDALRDILLPKEENAEGENEDDINLDDVAVIKMM